MVHKFYQDVSILGRPDLDGTMSSVTTMQVRFPRHPSFYIIEGLLLLLRLCGHRLHQDTASFYPPWCTWSFYIFLMVFFLTISFFLHTSYIYFIKFILFFLFSSIMERIFSYYLHEFISERTSKSSYCYWICLTVQKFRKVSENVCFFR